MRGTPQDLASLTRLATSCCPEKDPNVLLFPLVFASYLKTPFWKGPNSAERQKNHLVFLVESGWNRTRFDTHWSFVVLVILSGCFCIPRRSLVRNPPHRLYWKMAMLMFWKTLDHGSISVHSRCMKLEATPKLVAVSKIST